ncbi:hypothetical protein [Streptomyces sp. S1D4-20]|uniref:hypothetical protein n=1 Tax=Streptomyces sp. S1D4-20 TaxID=2594462 RepID=UPI001162DFAC|nr:hypothetical protein [Streptomyces sp. S1D4-20]QDN58699.1 hypothetical protein FNV67_28325 [Streptomyces sp. S1D4-20]
MPSRRPSPQPSLLVAIWWLFLAALAVVTFLGGVYFLFGSDAEPQPAPTATVTEVLSPSPLATSIPDSVIDDGLASIPTPSACTDANARGVIPRDRWTPCGQILGYFDDWTTPPPGAPAVLP